MTVPVAASIKAGDVAGKLPTRSGVSGEVPRRWVKMDLRNKGTFAYGEVNMTMKVERTIGER